MNKIIIENNSCWSFQHCAQVVAELLKTEYAYIEANREYGATFKYGRQGVSVGVYPICKFAPEDTLYFHFMNIQEKRNK